MNKIAFGLLFSLIAVYSTAMAEVSPETVVDIFQRIENLEKKARELHGKNEELQHQIRLLKKQQKDGFLAIDERIDELNTSGAKPAAKKQPADAVKKTEEPRVKIVNSTETTAPAKKEAVVEKAKPKPETPAVETKAKPEEQEAKKETITATPKAKGKAPSAYEKETYQSAFNLMKTSPSGASRAFKEYIKMQPNSPLAANAQYWIGEIMYSHNNYKGAVQEFIKVLQKYKYSDKAPDAAIKLGYSFYALKNWTYARRTFEDVLKYFPNNTNAVSLAKKRLEKMKAAGH